MIFFSLLIINLFASDDVLDIAEKYNSGKKQMYGLEKKRRNMLGEIYFI